MLADAYIHTACDLVQPQPLFTRVVAVGKVVNDEVLERGVIA